MRASHLSLPVSSAPHRPMLLALALCGWLSSCGGGTSTPSAAPAPQPAPTPAPTQPTAPTQPSTPTPTQPSTPAQPAPVLTLGQSAVTLTDGQSLSVPLTVNRLPDRVEVSGAPAGLMAQVSGGQVLLQTQGVQAGSYGLTVTGFWGQEQRQATVQVTVLAPAAPKPAPDFSLGLSTSRLSVTQGQSTSVGVNAARQGELGGDVQLSATASGGLRASFSGQTLLLDAAQATVGVHQVTVTGTAAGLTRTAQLTVEVTAQPAQISNVLLTATSTTLQAGQSTELRASVSGSGNFDGRVTWKVQADAGVQGQLSEGAGGTATLSVPESSASGLLRVTVTSVQDPTRTAQVVVSVRAAPQTVTVPVPQGGAAMSAGGSLTLSYQGAARSVELAQPSALVSGVRLQNATEQGGQVVLTAGTQSGSGTVQLAFQMADGSRFVLGVPVSVTAPAPAPAPAPTPAPTPATGGYVWYSESQRAVQADDLEVLRLTNEIRARGATCGTTAYAPAPALTWNDQLAYAARNHALDMGKRAYFDHVTPEGVKFSERITQAGYTWRTVGENIAAGYPSAAAVVDGWLKSPGHCANMMNPAFTEMGAGQAKVGSSPYGSYWAQEFGAPR